jgi:hypothetical protein
MTDPSVGDGTEFPALSDQQLNDLRRMVIGDPLNEQARRQSAAEMSYSALS